MNRRRTMILLGLSLCLLPASRVLAKGAGTPKTVPLRFSAKADVVPKKAPALAASGWVYGHATFATPLTERFEKKASKVNAVVKLLKGDRQLTSWLFWITDKQRAASTLVVEILTDPASSKQYNHKIPEALARLGVGTHELTVQVWSMYAPPERTLAAGKLKITVADGDAAKLTELAKDLKAAKRHAAELKRKAPTKPRGVSIKHDGVEILLLKDDVIVKDGAVVGSFDGTTIRKGGAIVGKMRDGEYRHEGSEAFQLTKGHRYPGTEIRYEGSIIGAITDTGNITWEGAQWGLVKPFDNSVKQKTRVFIALYLFSDFFRKK